MIRAFFNFFLFSSLYIAICAVIMTWQTDHILQLRYDSLNYYYFVFFATICSYNFHWYLTPGSINTSERHGWNLRRRKLQLLGCAIGLIGAIWFALPLLKHWLPVSGAVLLTFLYSAPKVPHKMFSWLSKIAIGKTIFLAFVWTYVTTVLPALIAGDTDTLEILYLTGHRFFLIYAICILFDYRDREQDRQQGIRSLITLLPDAQLDKLYYGSVLLAAVFALLLATAVPIFVLFSLLVPVTITAMIKRYAQEHDSDYLYYFYLDGLMMLSALLHLLWVSAGGI
ncbi:UbiA family prenyltransferase [Chitinophaga niabensis]|uniref:UbiA family prenyltransferase n=1 Tax=Chitinophaga niabensis TaxID=536979 RepID=UPI0031BAC262